MSTSIAPIPGMSRAGKGYAEVGLALGVVFIVALLMVPIPGLMLDMLLALSIGSSLVVLLVALYTTDPLEFSGFPSLLLILTLFRYGEVAILARFAYPSETFPDRNH